MTADSILLAIRERCFHCLSEGVTVVPPFETFLCLFFKIKIRGLLTVSGVVIAYVISLPAIVGREGHLPTILLSEG